MFSTFNVTFYFWLKIVKFYAFQIHKDYEDCLLEWWIFNFQLCSVKVFEAFLYNLGLHFRLMNIYVYSEFINFEQVFKAFLFLLVINLYVSVLIFLLLIWRFYWMIIFLRYLIVVQLVTMNGWRKLHWVIIVKSRLSVIFCRLSDLCFKYMFLWASVTCNEVWWVNFWSISTLLINLTDIFFEFMCILDKNL